eukprot:14836.XXX_815053_815349_1 [CDS] Oithona nana genome sequencing.
MSKKQRILGKILQLDRLDKQCWIPNFFWVSQTTFLSPQSPIDQVACVSIIIFIECKAESNAFVIVIESSYASIEPILPGVVSVLMDNHQKNESNCKHH